MRKLAREALAAAGVRNDYRIDNDLSLIDFIPTKSDHLRYFDGYLVSPSWYSGSMTRAVNDEAPVSIDAKGYDLVIIDTPHYVAIKGIESRRIFAVVHDLIPLRDPSMEANWRYLFYQKLKATLALSPNLIFVSNYSQEVFRQAFPNNHAPMKVVLYPAIRHALARAALGEGTAVEQGLDLETEEWDDIDADEDDLLADEPSNAYGPTSGALAKVSRWDSTLPYFTTAVSDEPRKNIALLVKAFQHLKGIANVVILGQINEKNYLPAGVDKLANVKFTGYVSDADKHRLFARATGVIFPSFSEGFGIPVVEGAINQLPVLCSDIPVLREVAGDDAFYLGSDAYLVKAVIQGL